MKAHEEAFDALVTATQENLKLKEQRDELILSLWDMIHWLDDGNRVLSDNCRNDVNKAIAVIRKVQASADQPRGAL